MKTISFQAFSDAGCMLFFDPESGFEVTPEWLHSMNHVADPDGRTCVAVEHPKEKWPGVWSQHFDRVQELGRNGEFALLLCDEVEYACKAGDSIAAGELERARASFEEWVHAPSGRLLIADAMAAFSGLDMKDEPFAEIEVTPGWNKVNIYHLNEPGSFERVIGFEGTTDHPAIIFVLTASRQPPEFSASRMVSRLVLPRRPTAGFLCDATVATADQQKVKLQLRQNHTTHSGHARLAASESVHLNPGDEIRVRLLENKGAYWKVELA